MISLFNFISMFKANFNTNEIYILAIIYFSVDWLDFCFPILHNFLLL